MFPPDEDIKLRDGAPEDIKKRFEEYLEARADYNAQWELAAWLDHEIVNDTEIIRLKEGAPEDMIKKYEEFKKRAPAYNLLRKIIILYGSFL
jgi:hypothetical protein